MKSFEEVRLECLTLAAERMGAKKTLQELLGEAKVLAEFTIHGTLPQTAAAVVPASEAGQVAAEFAKAPGGTVEAAPDDIGPEWRALLADIRRTYSSPDEARRDLTLGCTMREVMAIEDDGWRLVEPGKKERIIDPAKRPPREEPERLIPRNTERMAEEAC